jgi:hypothetical protein
VLSVAAFATNAGLNSCDRDYMVTEPEVFVTWLLQKV